jgi:hypothetical protein
MEVRRVAAVQRFAAAAFAWNEWLGVLESGSRLDLAARLDENNKRSAARQQAYNELLLICSDATLQWIHDVYDQAEYMVRRDVASRLIKGDPVTDAGRESARAYGTLLRTELIERLRPETRVLRDPAS